jgi:hypothetical protein
MQCNQPILEAFSRFVKNDRFATDFNVSKAKPWLMQELQDK